MHNRQNDIHEHKNNYCNHILRVSNKLNRKDAQRF